MVKNKSYDYIDYLFKKTRFISRVVWLIGVILVAAIMPIIQGLDFIEGIEQTIFAYVVGVIAFWSIFYFFFIVLQIAINRMINERVPEKKTYVWILIPFFITLSQGFRFIEDGMIKSGLIWMLLGVLYSAYDFKIAREADKDKNAHKSD